MRRLFGIVRPSVPLVLAIACYAALLAIVGRGIADRVSHPEPVPVSISDPCNLLNEGTVTAVLGASARDPKPFEPVDTGSYPLGTLEDELLVQKWGCEWSQPLRSTSEDRDYPGRSLSLEVRHYESERVARAMFDQIWRGQRFELPGADAALRETSLEQLSWRQGMPAKERARVDVTALDGTRVVEVSVSSGEVRYEATEREIAQRLLTRDDGLTYAERAAREVVRRL